MSYLGDFNAGAVIDFKFNTRAASSGTAVPFALSSGAIQVFKSNSTAATTAGVTLTSTFASVVGLNHCRIESTSDSTFYANGAQFEAYLSAGTVNSVSVVGELVGRFTLRGQAHLYPTVADRTLDVSAGGEAGVDWSNIGSPTTAVNLSGTTIKEVTDVQSQLDDATVGLAAIEALVDDIESRIGTPSDLGGGATIAANLVVIEGQTDDIGAAGAGLTAIPWNSAWDAEVESECNDALIGQNLDHLVKAAVDTDFATTVHLDSVIGHLADNGTAASFDRTTDSLEALEGKINTIDDFLDTEVAAIKAKTDQLTFGTANRVDAQVYGVETGAIAAGDIASAALNEIADAVLDRNMATGTDSGTNSTAVRTPRQALRAARNKVSIAAGTMTVTKEDDATTSWTAAVGTTAGDPISSVDPT